MLFVLGACLLVVTSVKGECVQGCDQPTLLYKGLQCQPIYKSAEDCCPSHFDCSKIRSRSSDDKCYFQGKAYDVSQEVDKTEIYGNCQIGCHCAQLSAGLGFRCAVLDCPEWLGMRPKPGCIPKYELDKCCSVGEACPPFKTTCKVNGTTYHEGQKFDPPNIKCTECVCDEGFQEGKYEEPFCKRSKCIDEVTNQNDVRSFCAPSYISLDSCCPFNWICPDDKDKIAKAPESELKCQFGKNFLNVGDKFERSHGVKGKVSCDCRIPPFLTCIQNYEYPAYASNY